MMKNKKGFEFSFGWMFAIIVGAIIIFLAIYSAAKFSSVLRVEEQTESGKQLGILLTPVETGVESAKKVPAIKLTAETRVYNECDDKGNFGKQEIRIASKTGLKEEWQDPEINNVFYNKYLFSEQITETKEKLYMFSVKMELPYLVASPVYLISDKEEYCFVTPPNAIENELEKLNIDKINITTSILFCSNKSNIVCFNSNSPGCNVSVSMSNNFVNKKGETVYFGDEFGNSLIYGAIFTNKELYECQVKRLMKRTSELALLYSEKARLLNSKGCSFANLDNNLIEYANKTAKLQDSRELIEIEALAKQIGEKNEDLDCELF